MSPTQAAYYLVSRSGYDILDWTYVQLLIDDQGIRPNLFYHPQYAAFSSFSSVAKSDFHGAAFSFRQRLGETLTYDVNYTFSKSLDNASGLQTGTSYGSQFILNALRPDDNYAASDFDTRHVINANFILQSPLGRGRRFFTDLNPVADAFLAVAVPVYRWNTGLPLSVPIDAAQWATNWNVQSSGTRIGAVDASTVRLTQNLFSDPAAAFASFRNARPGETGERNVLRLPGYSALDLGLSKSFRMPWGEGETHKLQFRWEVFNVLNYQYFLGDNFTRSTFGLPQDPPRLLRSMRFRKIFNRYSDNRA